MRIRGAALDQLRAVFEDGSLVGMSDAQLVERFTGGDEPRSSAAFSALVERHGPMVLRVCRAALGDEHDADDAFQAVFLVLLRKADRLWVRDSLGPWLHAVAVRTSAHAKARAQRRRIHEARHSLNKSEHFLTETDDLAALIHEEVARLPDRFRRPVVLCDLERLSHEEAARRLGWPIGTVKSRQSRGRERLKARLQRRGITAADSALATAFTPAQLAPSLTRAIGNAALVFKAGEVGASSAAVSLARVILRNMMMQRLSLSLFAIVAAGTLATGTAALTGPMFAAEEPPPPLQDAAVPPPAVEKAPRPPAGSLFEMRIVANTKHDAGAVEGDGYRWVKVDPKLNSPLDGLITKRDDSGNPMVLVKLDPQNLTERDLLEVRPASDERGGPAISFWMTRDGARRLGELTKAHLPEEARTFRYHLAIILKKTVVAMPMLNDEVRSAGVIEFGQALPPGEFDRLIALLADAASYNAPPLNTRAVKDQAEAVREAKDVDLPALENANRIRVESAKTGARIYLADPRVVASFLRALRPNKTPPSGGEVAARISFFHDDDLIRKVWVYDGGEWGFERPGTSWTTGADAELWRLVELRVTKGRPVPPRD